MYVDGPSANAPVDNQSVSQRVYSAEWLFSSESFNGYIFSWSRFQRPSCPLAFFCTPDVIHALLHSNNDRVAYTESFSSLSVEHNIPTACHFSASDSFRRAILKLSLESLKFYLCCMCRYWFETPAKLEFCKGTDELIKPRFVVL
jgi:hypothetical protein